MSMPQFTPAPREEVLEASRDSDHTHAATKLGTGVIESWKHGWDDDGVGYTTLTENHGWYVAEVITNDSGNYAILMPITEVDRE